jgi:hypothetical protein
VKFLLDANVVEEVGRLLKRLGFEVESVYNVPVDIRNDRAIVGWAHRQKYILLTHDRFRDRRTIEPVADEMRRRGGRVIVIRGSPAQSPYETVGKMLVHLETWSRLIRRRSGIVRIDRQSCTFKQASDLLAILQKRLPVPREIEAAVKERRRARRSRKKRRVLPPPEQRELPDAGAAA